MSCPDSPIAIGMAPIDVSLPLRAGQTISEGVSKLNSMKIPNPLRKQEGLKVHAAIEEALGYSKDTTLKYLLQQLYIDILRVFN